MRRTLWMIVTVLATLRVVRFITTDWLGHWWIVRPARTWALRHWPEVTKGWTTVDGQPSDVSLIADHVWQDIDVNDPTAPKPVRLVKGLDCGYCLSPWLIGGALIAGAILEHIPVVRVVWRWLLATLGLSWIIGHVWEAADA